MLSNVSDLIQSQLTHGVFRGSSTSLFEFERLFDQGRYGRQLGNKSESPVFVDSDLGRDDLTLLVLSGLVVLIDEFHDVDAVLAQHRTDRGGGISSAGRKIELENNLNLFRHEVNFTLKIGYNQDMRLSAEQKNQIRDYFTGRPEVAAVYLYGSQTSGRAGALSDVDLGMLLKRRVDRNKKLDLQLEYISAVQSVLRVDLAADVKLLEEEDGLAYLARVVNEGEVLVVNDVQEHQEFVHRVAMLYPDFYPALQHYFAVMEERIKEGTYATG